MLGKYEKKARTIEHTKPDPTKIKTKEEPKKAEEKKNETSGNSHKMED